MYAVTKKLPTGRDLLCSAADTTVNSSRTKKNSSSVLLFTGSRAAPGQNVTNSSRITSGGTPQSQGNLTGSARGHQLAVVTNRSGDNRYRSSTAHTREQLPVCPSVPAHHNKAEDVWLRLTMSSARNCSERLLEGRRVDEDGRDGDLTGKIAATAAGLTETRREDGRDDVRRRRRRQPRRRLVERRRPRRSRDGGVMCGATGRRRNQDDSPTKEAAATGGAG
uniref:Uncharacterized protein n=1 Tax=Arundo donax TaxID=35708 RepID=A0A0A9HK45_ARUDO